MPRSTPTTSSSRAPGIGATIRSTDAHARFVALDLDPAFDWSTVVVVTAADIPGDNIVSSIKEDQPILVPVGGEIQHHAEPLALIAAPDRATLRAARRAVTARTEPLPGGLRPARVRPRVRGLRDRPRRPGCRASPPPTSILEGEYRVGHQEQLYIENNAMIAVPARGRRGDRPRLAPVPVLRPHGAQARRSASTTARRGSSRPRPAAGSAARRSTRRSSRCTRRSWRGKAERPVRMIYDRHEDIAATTKRHPAIVRHRTGVTRDGRLLAQDIEVVMDGGAYCTLTPVVLSRGALHAGGPYRCPNVRIRARATRTNTPPNGAFRGFGAPQTEFAAETHLNRIAEALGLSPLEIRRRNVYRLGDTTPTGQVLRDERRRRGGPRARRRGRRVRAAARAPRGRARAGGRAPGRSRLAAADRPATGCASGHRAGARVARRRVHRLGRGQARVGRLARADRRRPHPAS